MDVGSAFVASPQSSEVVQPGEGSLDDPAQLAQTGAVSVAAAGDLWCDAALAQQAPVLVVVVAAIGEHRAGPSFRAASQAANRWDGIDQGQQLSDVVAVAAGQDDRER